MLMCSLTAIDLRLSAPQTSAYSNELWLRPWNKTIKRMIINLGNNTLTTNFTDDRLRPKTETDEIILVSLFLLGAVVTPTAKDIARVRNDITCTWASRSLRALWRHNGRWEGRLIKKWLNYLERIHQKIGWISPTDSQVEHLKSWGENDSYFFITLCVSVDWARLPRVGQWVQEYKNSASRELGFSTSLAVQLIWFRAILLYDPRDHPPLKKTLK